MKAARKSDRAEHRQWLRSHLPEDGAVEAALQTSMSDGQSVVLLERLSHQYASSFPAEILRCRMNGTERLVLCKYGIDQRRPTYGHRSGVAYEALVYREVLAPSGLTAPRFLGAHAVPGTSAVWLFLDYLADAVRTDETPQPRRSLRKAAGWIATFHALNEQRVAHDLPLPLATYDHPYYAAWARRSDDFVRRSDLQAPWLSAVAAAFEELAAELVAVQPTVIHGEYTPHNVLVADSAPYPVDWESAAIGCWAIDLVSLSLSWPARVVRACEEDYLRTRWPEGAPDGFRRLMDIAQLYWDFRWFGDRPEWLNNRRLRARLPHLRATGKRLGAI
jgi:hypothetical protein